jgi:hypothetical protein
MLSFSKHRHVLVALGANPNGAARQARGKNLIRAIFK